MAKRYCGPCDELVKGRECPKCGADTDAAVTRATWQEHVCHDMNPPFGGPCPACESEKAEAERKDKALWVIRSHGRPVSNR